MPNRNHYSRINSGNKLLHAWEIYIVMKRKCLTGILLMAAMCCTLTACKDIGKKNKLERSTEQVIYSDTTDAEPLTIGYTFWDVPVDGFAMDQASQIKLVAKALNVNLIFNPDNTDFSADSMVKAAKYFAEQKVDGMIVVNFSEESLVEISQICEDGKIPFIQATRTINDKDVANKVEGNPFYVGRIHESEYAAAYEVGRKLIERGSKNIIMLCPEHGDVAYEARAEGFRDACEEPDVNIIEERWELADDGSAAEATKELIEKYPETDGIFTIRCGFVPQIVDGQDALSLKEYIPIVGVDLDNTIASYVENGAVVAAAGGHHPDASLSLITLVNSIRGAYDKSEYPIDINYSMILIDSKEAFSEYKDWCLGYDVDFDNRQILNANDARSLCVDYNKNTTLADITSFAENMSLENVMERHSGLINNDK